MQTQNYIRSIRGLKLSGTYNSATGVMEFFLLQIKGENAGAAQGLSSLCGCTEKQTKQILDFSCLYLSSKDYRRTYIYIYILIGTIPVFLAFNSGKTANIYATHEDSILPKENCLQTTPGVVSLLNRFPTQVRAQTCSAHPVQAQHMAEKRSSVC